eukprot:3175419-Pleurochrysis_carterae.AAC.1
MEIQLTGLRDGERQPGDGEANGSEDQNERKRGDRAGDCMKSRDKDWRQGNGSREQGTQKE